MSERCAVPAAGWPDLGFGAGLRAEHYDDVINQTPSATLPQVVRAIQARQTKAKPKTMGQQFHINPHGQEMRQAQQAVASAVQCPICMGYGCTPVEGDTKFQNCRLYKKFHANNPGCWYDKPNDATFKAFCVLHGWWNHPTANCGSIMRLRTDSEYTVKSRRKKLAPNTVPNQDQPDPKRKKPNNYHDQMAVLQKGVEANTESNAKIQQMLAKILAKE